MRKLLSVTCIASLIFSLISPVFADSNSPTRQTTWGLLKSRYGEELISQPNPVKQAITLAILSNPYLSNGEVLSIGKLGPVDYGFYGIGLKGGTVPFIVFVDGNLAITNIFAIDEIPDPRLGPNRVGIYDLLNSQKLIWQGTPDDFQRDHPIEEANKADLNTARNSLHPLDRSVNCWAVAGAAASAAADAAVKAKVPWYVKAVVVGGTLWFAYSACMNEHHPRIYGEDEHPIGSSHDLNKPRPGDN